MRAETISKTTEIQLETVTTVDEDGDLTTTITVPTHGRAVKTYRGRIARDGNMGWMRFDGMDIVDYKETKTELLRDWVRHCEQDMVRWVTG